MTPYEQARRLWAERECWHTFEADEEWHRQHGYVFITPEFVLMGFRASRAKLIASGDYPRDCYDPQGDCWYVFAAAGSVQAAVAATPYPLPFIAWHRTKKQGKKLQIVPSGRIPVRNKGYMP